MTHRIFQRFVNVVLGKSLLLDFKGKHRRVQKPCRASTFETQKELFTLAVGHGNLIHI